MFLSSDGYQPLAEVAVISSSKSPSAQLRWGASLVVVVVDVDGLVGATGVTINSEASVSKDASSLACALASRSPLEHVWDAPRGGRK